MLISKGFYFLFFAFCFFSYFLFVQKTLIISSLISYFCITRGPWYLVMMHKIEYKANCLRPLNSNTTKRLISKVLLKLRIDHGGEGIILDSHGEDYLTMLGRCLYLSAVRLLMMDLRKNYSDIYFMFLPVCQKDTSSSRSCIKTFDCKT